MFSHIGAAFSQSGDFANSVTFVLLQLAGGANRQPERQERPGERAAARAHPGLTASARNRKGPTAVAVILHRGPLNGRLTATPQPVPDLCHGTRRNGRTQPS